MRSSARRPSVAGTDSGVGVVRTRKGVEHLSAYTAALRRIIRYRIAVNVVLYDGNGRSLRGYDDDRTMKQNDSLISRQRYLTLSMIFGVRFPLVVIR